MHNRFFTHNQASMLKFAKRTFATDRDSEMLRKWAAGRKKQVVYEWAAMIGLGISTSLSFGLLCYLTGAVTATFKSELDNRNLEPKKQEDEIATSRFKK
jgi:hypothetical protein